MGYIDAAQLERLAEPMKKNAYGAVPARRSCATACSDVKAIPHRDPRRPGDRAAGLRRRARLLLRELEPAAPSTTRVGREVRVRAGQPFARRRAACCAGCTTRCSSRRESSCAWCAGEVFDVAVDLRRSSPTFGRWVGERLSADEPPHAVGARGLRARLPRALRAAPSSSTRRPTTTRPQHERTLLWNDPALGIAWPLEGEPRAEAQGRGGHAARAGRDLSVMRVLVTGARRPGGRGGGRASCAGAARSSAHDRATLDLADADADRARACARRGPTSS